MYPSLPSPPSLSSTPNRAQAQKKQSPAGTMPGGLSGLYDPKVLVISDDDPIPGLILSTHRLGIRDDAPTQKTPPAKPRLSQTHRSVAGSPNSPPDSTPSPKKSPNTKKSVRSPRKSRLAVSNSAEDLFKQPIDVQPAQVDPSIFEFDSPDAIVDGFKSHIRLRPHQIIGRQWMKEREDPHKAAFGGLLADEMGLGKTVQVITLIVDSIKQKRSNSPTLVVCPSVLLIDKWENECDDMTKAVSHCRFHGPKRSKNADAMLSTDIILTTYDTMKSDFEGDPNSFLFRTYWNRVVIDEAHHIRNHDSQKSKAACALKATFRWCLTGTPLQNSVTDLYPLFKFLAMPKFDDLVWFESHIAKPLSIENEEDRGDATPAEAMQLLQDAIRKITLRRFKAQEYNGCKLVDIPAKFVHTVQCKLDEGHRVFYGALSARSRSAAKHLDPNTTTYKRHRLLVLRLRQACNHPCLIFKEDIIMPEMEFKCRICSATLSSDVEEQYCSKCQPLIQQARSFSLHTRDTRTGKINETVKILRGTLQRGEKSIVYSQWTTMLNILERVLCAENIKFVRCDGKMTVNRRKEALNAIEEDDSVGVVLISLMAAGEGLDLQVCNNVIFVDPWWNPSVEHQAFDRVHRIGQVKEVHVYKLVTDLTIEGRILELQERKEKLAQEVMDGDTKSAPTMNAATLKDLLLGGSNDVHTSPRR